jgi:flagellar motor protein MotB
MRKTGTSFSLLSFILVTAFCSCVSQKRVASAKNRLTTIDSQLLSDGKTLKKLDAQRIRKQERNEMDDTTSSRIQKFITNSNTEIGKLVAQNTILIGTTEVKRADWEQLKKSLSFSGKTSRLLDNKALMLSDLISRNTVVRIDQDVVFESGQYTVAPAMADSIAKLFEPAAKEIDQFILKYPDFPLSLVITARGYADGASIAEGTSLYRDLVARLKLKVNPPDNKELNKELSNARAEAVILLFKKFSAGQAANGYNVNNVLYIFEGKGDALPDLKIQDYKTDDPRRRVVLLFWSLFPE